MRRVLRWAAGGLLAMLVLAGGALSAWVATGPAATAAALQALETDAAVTVEAGRWLVFTPAGAAPATGLILYPGGRVDARAYAPVARAIAVEGYRVVVVPMPLKLAVLSPDRADEVIAAYPEVKAWAVGGHSLGGAMAARFALTRPEAVQGLALWAAYPAESDDLSGRELAVVSIYGTQDGVATEAEVTQAAARLPAGTRWVRIDGGNHAQFGSYGPQAGDGAATISAEVQQAATTQATVALLAGLPAP